MFIKETFLMLARRWLYNAARRRMLHLSPRRWSNEEIRHIAPYCKGDVANISGWKDEDKEGGHYHNYFSHASTYAVTNYFGTSSHNDGEENSVFFNLTGEVPSNLVGRFDTCFCHTVLEHVFDLSKAFKNLSAITREGLLLVVPFMQNEHYADVLYGDYWRFTPLGLRHLFESTGFHMIYLSANDSPWYPIYLVSLAVRNPTQWPTLPPSQWIAKSRIGNDTYIYENFVW